MQRAPCCCPTALGDDCHEVVDCAYLGRRKQHGYVEGQRYMAKLRILLSEGSSTSAREALTILHGKGYEVEICDPGWHCLTRFSRLAARFHLCPPLRDDPAGYLAFIEDLLKRRHFDVLLPVHEQGLLFSRVRERLSALTAIALPSFESYWTVVRKSEFSHLLEEISLNQPPTRVVFWADVAALAKYPCVVKSPIGTASRGTAVLRNPADIPVAQAAMAETNVFSNEVLLQEFIRGEVEHAQAVFWNGELIGFRLRAADLIDQCADTRSSGGFSHQSASPSFIAASFVVASGTTFHSTRSNFLQALLPGLLDCVRTNLPSAHKPATRALIRSIG
jgi:hypothetical protein